MHTPDYDNQVYQKIFHRSQKWYKDKPQSRTKYAREEAS